jgi:hypothetical protein
MQKAIELRGPKSEAASEPLAAPPSIEPILAVVDSLARTLDCIKTMCATEPTGPIRDRLETERANLVIGLFVARVAAMRLSSGAQASDISVNANLPSPARDDRALAASTPGSIREASR